MATSITAIDRLQNVLKTSPFDIDSLTNLLSQDSFREELSHDDVAWSALDAVCDFLQVNKLELDTLGDLLCYLGTRANPREFILGLSDRLSRIRSDLAWSYLIRPLAISIKKLIAVRPPDGAVEDAIHAAISSYLVFSTAKFDEMSDPVKVSKICSNNVVRFVDQFFAEEFRSEELGMYSVAACLTLAATPLSMVAHENKWWRSAVNKLCEVVLHYSNPYAILADLTDINHRPDRFLGCYFFNNSNGRWGHLKAGLACLLSANNSDFCLPQVLEPRFSFFLCSGIAASLLSEITCTPNPDMDGQANAHQCTLAFCFITNLLSSVPPDSFNSECISSVPSFTLLVRRLFLNLTGSQSFFTVDREAALQVVKIIEEFMTRLDFTGKWQLVWMWVNQVPADGHPAGPVRAAAIDKCRSLLAWSMKSNPELLAEKVAKMLPMILTLVIARDNVLDGQAGLVRVDAATSALSFIQYILLVPPEKNLINEQTRKTLGAWLEYELRPSVASTRNFLQGASTSDSLNQDAAKANPWICFSSQLLSRLDIVECTLARVEQIHEQQMNKKSE